MSVALKDPSPLHIRANALRHARRLDEAERLYRDLLAVDWSPEAATEHAMVLLAQGRLSEGWPLYDHRRERAWLLRQNLTVPEWRGENLAGKRLLVWREQGFGDQILAARYLPHTGAAHVTYAGPPELQRLLSPLVDRYEPVANSLKLAAFDYWTQPLSLPGLISDRPTTPYISVPGHTQAGRFGVMANTSNDPRRSLSPDLADALLAQPGALNLEPNCTGARDFYDTARLIAGLDLVVSVDTAVAHLAGAMGKPLWVMLLAQGLDWQWPRHDASLWYSTARGFSQPTPGDWGSVVAEVTRALADAGKDRD